jgi:hypothetical protein
MAKKIALRSPFLPSEIFLAGLIYELRDLFSSQPEGAYPTNIEDMLIRLRGKSSTYVPKLDSFSSDWKNEQDKDLTYYGDCDFFSADLELLFDYYARVILELSSPSQYDYNPENHRARFCKVDFQTLIKIAYFFRCLEGSHYKKFSMIYGATFISNYTKKNKPLYINADFGNSLF